MQNEERKLVLKMLAVRHKAKLAFNMKQEHIQLKDTLKLDGEHALQEHTKMVQKAKEVYESR